MAANKNVKNKKFAENIYFLNWTSYVKVLSKKFCYNFCLFCLTGGDEKSTRLVPSAKCDDP